LTSEEEQDIINSIQQMLNNYYKDISKEGLTAEFNYLDNSPDFFWVPPGYSTAISYDSVAKILKLNAPLFRSVDNAFDTLRITPLNRESAIYTARLSSIMTDTSGVVSKLLLVETGVLIKRNDGWKLLSGQTSVVEE
jgi:hypothetical protein